MRTARSLIVLVLALLPATVAAQAKIAAFAGTVVDSAKQPLSNAEVSLPGLGLMKTTNDKGVFRIEGVPAGVHRLTVKHIGYSPVDTVMAFSENERIEWIVTLGRITLLDSVLVAEPVDPLLVEFAENRKRGFGRFMTRADLAKYDMAPLPTVIRSMSGIGIIRNSVGQSFVSASRGPITRCRPERPMGEGRQAALEAQERTDDCLRRERLYYVPDESEKRQGILRSCYSLVYADRMLMNPGMPTQPFDISTFPTEQIEAIEWYSSPSQTPAKYSIRKAECGVLVLHLRKKR